MDRGKDAVGSSLRNLSSLHFTTKPAIFSLIRLLTTFLLLPLTRAIPTSRFAALLKDAPPGTPSPKPANDPQLWAYLGAGVGLTLLGGAFAGLTIALMGQDELNLQVIATSGEGSEKNNASSVLRLLKRGKHWVLVTLLLGNVITNETLPLCLDRALGGGVAAAVSSTVLVVIFGEIVPQSICVRYGLPIGAWMAPFVLVLMWFLAPIAWPTAKLLDYLLGEDHGTVYKKAGLKTLVGLHKSMGAEPEERLNQDEVTIIGAVLDLKDKSVGSIMTPMNDVFTMSADAVLDQAMVDEILQAGYSRIPIYEPSNPRNFIGMLIVKLLITYDPEDCWKVKQFSLATLPETAPTTSCLDIINFFQEGKSHMVLVSDYPGEPYGALGVVTLEDVIEELIGEEIVDESDVYVDVHKAIRRIGPGPIKRGRKADVATDSDATRTVAPENLIDVSADSEQRTHNEQDGDAAPSKRLSVSESNKSPNPTNQLTRRKSSASGSMDMRTPPLRKDTGDMRQHLRHLGPSNLASRPKATRYNTVKIKQGFGSIPENSAKTEPPNAQAPPQSGSQGPEDGVRTQLPSSAGMDGKDGVLAVAKEYGTLHSPTQVRASAQGNSNQGPTSDMNSPHGSPTEIARKPEKLVIGEPKPPSRSSSDDSLRSLHSRSPSKGRRKGTARSGSITEQIVDLGGIKKIVLQTATSDSEDEQSPGEEKDVNGESAANGKKRGRSRSEKANINGTDHNEEKDGESSESTPLLKKEY